MTAVQRRELPIHMEPEALLDIGGVVQRRFGVTLRELARRDPAEAYRVLRLAQLAFIGSEDESDEDTGVTYLDGRGVAMTRDDAREALDRRMPVVPLWPMRVSVNTFETMAGDGTPLLRDGIRPSTEQISFDVDPPDNVTA